LRKSEIQKRAQDAGDFEFRATRTEYEKLFRYFF